MKMGGAWSVGNGTNRPEVITALRTGEESTIPLKVGIALLSASRPAGMDIASFGVCFPEFDDNARGRGSVAVENLPVEVGDFSDRRLQRIVDQDEIIIRVEGQFVRIERAFRLEGSDHQLLGKKSRCRKKGGRTGEGISVKIGDDGSPGKISWRNEPCGGDKVARISGGKFRVLVSTPRWEPFPGDCLAVESGSGKCRS